ncbi:TPA: galactose oxidase, partial [Candidatus Poribacteria bacterium]|nr:galactose oxidase [Candidatus Poribacteria bacterium]
DTWTPITTEGVPEARNGHTAIWTGKYMIVWGGAGSGGVSLNTGGRYDPSTDTWTPITTEGVPEARNGHTTIWTGNQMIVWGGSDDEGVSNTGAKFSE